jgi:hypothetical protein
MAGVTIRAISVELISPPIKTIAIGEKSGESSSSNGVIPPIAVALVSSTRQEAHFAGALDRLVNRHAARARNWLANSTSRIEFLISMPISAMKPMIAVNESDSPDP